MVTHMKTTVELGPTLLQQAKRLASRRGTTLRALIEEGLRHVLAERGGAKRRYVLPATEVRGRGPRPGVVEGGWGRIRELIYEGRDA